jgi:hypothetical protein
MFNPRAGVVFALIILLIMKFILILISIVILTFIVGCLVSVGIMFFLLNYQSNPFNCMIGEGIIIGSICAFIYYIRYLRSCLD